MSAYYNENDPFAAEWLRNLIKEGLIADGEVDSRSIVDVRSADLAGYQQCHFFAGIGGWSYALRLAGWSDDRPVWTGSCPCQPFSVAGKQKGFADDRHLWPVWRDLIGECGPSVVFGEQVASATDWLGLVRSDLEAMGYAVGAFPIQAASAGADHLRDRYWFVADNDTQRAELRKLECGASQRPEEGRGIAPSGRRANGAVGDRRSAGLSLPKREAVLGTRGWKEGRATTESSSSLLADADSERQSQWAQSHSGALAGQQASRRDDAMRCGGAVVDADSKAGRRETRDAYPRTRAEAVQEWPQESGRCGGYFEWVIGADGKARRVKPGVRLLAHGFPNRVGLLRGFGNAIDPRPAAALIKAAMI